MRSCSIGNVLCGISVIVILNYGIAVFSKLAGRVFLEKYIETHPSLFFSAAVSIAVFEQIIDWKIEARAIPCVTNPEKIPENIRRKSGALGNASRNPKNAPKRHWKVFGTFGIC